MQTVPWGTGEYSKHGKEIRLLSCHSSQIARQCTLEIIYYAKYERRNSDRWFCCYTKFKKKKKKHLSEWLVSLGNCIFFKKNKRELVNDMSQMEISLRDHRHITFPLYFLFHNLQHATNTLMSPALPSLFL